MSTSDELPYSIA